MAESLASDLAIARLIQMLANEAPPDVDSGPDGTPGDEDVQATGPAPFDAPDDGR